MGERPDEIERHIEEQRGELSDKIRELQHKVKATFDWRAQFRQRPLAIAGLAFAGGFFLSTALAGQRSRRRAGGESRPTESSWPPISREVAYPERHSPAVERQKQRARETLDNVKGALIGIAASKLRELLGEAIPEFDEQYRSVERDRSEAQGSRQRLAALPSESGFGRAATAG